MTVNAKPQPEMLPKPTVSATPSATGKKAEFKFQIEAENEQQWQALLKRDGLIVIDVYSSWAGPCAPMVPTLKRLKVEINDDRLWYGLACADHIEALIKLRDHSEPCWLFMAAGKPVKVVRGCHVPNLVATIKAELAHEIECMQGKGQRNVLNIFEGGKAVDVEAEAAKVLGGEFPPDFENNMEFQKQEEQEAEVPPLSVAVSAVPSATPSAMPSATPSAAVSKAPSAVLSATPSAAVSKAPSAVPSANPSAAVSKAPSAVPSATPSAVPSATPSAVPSATPSAVPSATPSVSKAPSAAVSTPPPAAVSTAPSATVSKAPSAAVSTAPPAAVSTAPSAAVSKAPSAAVSKAPSTAPSAAFSKAPSESPKEEEEMKELKSQSVVPQGSQGEVADEVLAKMIPVPIDERDEGESSDAEMEDDEEEQDE